MQGIEIGMEQEFGEALDRCWALGRRGEPDLALATALDLRVAAEAAGSAGEVAACSQRIAWFCLQQGDVETGLDHARVAKDHWAREGDVLREAASRAVFAWLMLECGLTEEAAGEALEALAQAERCGDEATLAFALNVLAVVFWACRQLKRAQVLSERSVDIARGLDDPVTLGWWLINLGGIHSEIAYRARAAGEGVAFARSIATALSINAEALALLAPARDGWGLRIGLCNAAEYYVEAGETAAAEACLRRWTEVPGRSGTRTDAQYYSTKARVLIQRRQWIEALAVCGLSLELAQQARNSDSEAHALRFMSEIYEGLLRFDTALGYFKRFHDAQSRMSADRIQRRARIAEIHYETERFKRLADEATELAGVASRRAEELAVSALRDPLTGLGNRRSLDLALDDLRASGRPYAVAVVDLDHFKRINDTFTHMVGDEVLRRVAATILGQVRSCDAVVRMGGEEFVVIFRDVDLAAAMALCLGLNAGLAAAPWSDLRPGLRVTASIGVAASPEAAGAEAVLGLADQRVYSAKASGRDRVVGGVSSDAGETGPVSGPGLPVFAAILRKSRRPTVVKTADCR